MYVVCPICKDERDKRETCPRCGGIGEVTLSYEELAAVAHGLLSERDELEARLENANRDCAALLAAVEPLRRWRGNSGYMAKLSIAVKKVVGESRPAIPYKNQMYPKP
jgi:hypothetical protein